MISNQSNLSSRTERSVVKDLVDILVGVFEILRFALNDNNGLDLNRSVSACQRALPKHLFRFDNAKEGNSPDMPFMWNYAEFIRHKRIKGNPYGLPLLSMYYV